MSSSGKKDESSATKIRPALAEQAVKCPRCDSPNTKFCYYNNYSLTQPRHYCKTCRRYWTKGGALRQVPVGGARRKNKKPKSSSNFSHATVSPATMDFDPLLLNNAYPFPSPTLDNNQLCPLIGEVSTATTANPPTSCYYPATTLSMGFNGGLVPYQDMYMGPSIDSMNAINQDLHWKLEQQKLAMLLLGGDLESQTDNIILFDQNQEISELEGCAADHNSRRDSPASAGIVTDHHHHHRWFFDNSYPVLPLNHTTPTNTSSCNGHENTSNWNGIQAWRPPS